MEENNFEGFKERAYQILYEKYSSALNKLIQDSINNQNRDGNSGELLLENREEYIHRKSSMFEQIGLIKRWSHYGLMSKEDIAIVKTLEHCLDIESGLRKDTG